MKKIFLALAMLTMTLATNAQSDTPFAKGKFYASAGLSGFGLGYNANSKWNMDITTKGGYLFKDNWMGVGEFTWGLHQKSSNTFVLGAGARYYIEQNGLYLGAGMRFKHYDGYDDFMPNVNIGYAYFLNHYLTIEPELYFDISTKDFSEYSGFGLRIGLGCYF